jgi:peptide/nickel transport system substrate-binding protein
MGAKPFSVRRTRRAVLRLSGTVAAAGLVAACSSTHSGSGSRPAGQPSGSNSGQPRPGGTLNDFTGTNVTDLDIYKTGGQGTTIATGYALSRVIKFKTSADPAVTLSSDVEGDLAASWESPDAITWTFKIRPGGRFHDIPPVNGHAVESEDIRQSLQREISVGGPGSSGLAMIDPAQIQTPAPDTVVFKLKTPTGAFTKVLGVNTNPIFPREASGGYDPSKLLIGSGPFVFDTNTPDVAITFKRNPAWSQAGKPNADGARAAIIPDESQQLAQFTAGNLDIVTVGINNLDTEQRSNPKAQALSYLQRSEIIFVGHMNFPDSPFHDPRVRHALSMAIDRNAVGRAVLGNKYAIAGLVSPAFGKWALPVDQLGDATKYFKYDPNAAKQLLQAAGATDAFHSIFYPNNGYGTQFNTVVETVNSMFNAIGLKTRLVPLDYQKDFLNSGKGVSYGNYPPDGLIVVNSGGYSTAEDWLVSNFTPNTPRNKSQVVDDGLIASITKMIAIVDEDQRLKAVHDIDRYLADAMYYVPAPYAYIATMVQPRVRDFQLSVNVPQTESYAQLWLQS